MASLSHGSSYLPQLQHLAITLGKTNIWASELEPGGFESTLKNFVQARALAQAPSTTTTNVVLRDDDEEILDDDDDYDDHSHRRQQPISLPHRAAHSRSHQQTYPRQRPHPHQQAHHRNINHHAREPVVFNRLLVFQCSSESAAWLRKRVRVLEIQDLSVFYPRPMCVKLRCESSPCTDRILQTFLARVARGRRTW